MGHCWTPVALIKGAHSVYSIPSMALSRIVSGSSSSLLDINGYDEGRLKVGYGCLLGSLAGED